jgi:hypothetical protein
MNTLRYFSLAGAFTGAVLMAHAQEFRFSGGYNGSNVSEAGPEAWAGRAGYQFGVDAVLGQRWFLKPGVHFLVRNLDYSLAFTDAEGNPVTTNEEFQYTSRSLRVPVHVGLRILDPANDPGLNIYAFGGPSALMNLNADLDNDELDVETNAAQWYLGFGGGLELGFLFVEAGYDVAMSNVFKGDDFRTNPKVNYVYASAGLRLRLAD